jgi:LytR cell envelope-related transcriptional attenuator
MASAVLGAACGSPRLGGMAPSPSSGALRGASETSPAAISPSAPAHVSFLIGPSWFALVVADGAEPARYGLALPPQTSAQVPGYGSLTLEQARARGGRPLAAAAVSGLLGIALDRSANVADPSPPQLAGGAAYDRLPLRPTPSDVQALVSAHLSAARLTGERAFGRRVELRDGTGSTTAARQASLLLAASGFVTARQAPAAGGISATTRIVVYSGTEASKRIGGEAAEALGTGTVAVSGQAAPQSSPQSGLVVDVTVILGSDFVGQANESQADNGT